MSSAKNILAVLGLFVLMAVVTPPIDAALFRAFGLGADTTDSKDRRSGMALHRDDLTGCEYLASPWGGITPRVNGLGEHVGCK